MMEDILGKMAAYCNDYDADVVRNAYQFGMKAHLHQKRYSGEPYFEHCLNVAKILADLRMDQTTIVAGLLHDVVEDTPFELEDIRNEFGKNVALLVDGVTKISELKFESKELRQAETFRKMLLSMARDVRVIIIKFADRLHNVRTLDHVPERKRPRIALETRDVYAPLAHRFGIASIKWEMEDLALKHLEPEAYNELAKKIKLTRAERERYIKNISDPIIEEMKKNNIHPQISGRPKSFFSIYNKMKKRNRPFEEIYDLLAIRIIVEKVEECYYTLGIIHSLYNPVYDRFKDYIAMPKINGYQSLHTTVVGPDGKMVEIQIRTKAMHVLAEDGIAAHWKYKHGDSDEDPNIEAALNWVKELLDRQVSEDAGEFMEDLKIDLFHDEVFLFSPKGDLYKLPADSSPIDFAYAVHTKVGNHCIGAKVNGKIVPLRTTLKSGDQVEIITSQNQKPSQDWLNFVKTSKARHWIKKVIREEQQAQTRDIGTEILNKFLKKYKLTEKSPEFQDVIPKMGFSNLESLIVAIGRGEVVTDAILKKLYPNKPAAPPKEESFFKKYLKRSRDSSGIRVQGLDNMLINFARCCHPVPGDSIIGYLSRGKGVTIHRSDCKNLIYLLEEKQRIIDVEWDTEKNQEFLVHLRVIGEDRKDLLRDITNCVSKQDINIVSVTFSAEDLYARGNLNVEVKDLHHLTKVINNINKLPGVFSVERVNEGN
ncbi:MAG: bifunctional (p)ppGpp synthetase/guanosine-3',5'-bis(diphosphate) 3'-pyrophosphohydrolase [Calditrichaeota bacterium]|nr:MAG: bifunctional (p)ppGpp synthetase/guanosine-3',5'-bis(diphosphate) 3'-pyrophosphohydrolase [Calditrichota bacterium]